MQYAKSTRERVGDIVRGFRVNTASLEASTYFHQNSSGLFNVYGVIRVMYLFGEITEVLSAEAAVVKFRFQSTDPVIAVQDMCGSSASVASLAVGERIFWVGGVVATLAVLTATPGISDVNPAPQLVGTDGGTGHIEIQAETADMTDGNVVFYLFYHPMSDGAYATAAV